MHYVGFVTEQLIQEDSRVAEARRLDRKRRGSTEERRGWRRLTFRSAVSANTGRPSVADLTPGQSTTRTAPATQVAFPTP